MELDLNPQSSSLPKIVAAIMAITGIVMMAYADGFHGDSIIGVALAVGSASTSALYKVCLLPEPSCCFLKIFVYRYISGINE